MAVEREHLLLDLLHQIANEEKYENPEIETFGVPITGANFTSQLFQATIKAKGKNVLNCFVKVEIMTEEMRVEAGDPFLNEHYYYSKLARTYKEIEDKHNVPEEHRLFLPKFYAYSNSYSKGVLVLQDLSKHGFVTYDRLKSIDWDYASKAVEEMAKLHALSMAYQKEYPEDFEDTLKVLKNSVYEENGILAQILDGSKKRIIPMIREQNRAKMQKFLEECSRQSFVKFYQPKSRPVIIHTDYRQSNLMHRIHKDGKLQVSILDYQTVHPGRVTVDLLYFIFTGSDGAFRAKYFDQLVELYYENLAANLKRLGLDIEETFPKNHFDEELKETLPYGLIISSISLPIITMDLADVTKTDSGEFDLDTLLAMGDKAGTDSLCAQRINEVVDDYVKWGVL